MAAVPSSVPSVRGSIVVVSTPVVAAVVPNPGADELEQDIPSSATMANIRTVSSLTEIDLILQEMNINTIDQAGQVQFRLHEQTSLKEATKIKTRTYPGRHGFILVNPELLNCKFSAEVLLEDRFNAMLRACMEQCDDQLRPLKEHIAALRHQMFTPDGQIGHIGPPLNERGRGVQHVIYPNPPFPIFPSYEYGNNANQRPPYQPPYATPQERDAAVSRDKRAQRAVWRANLHLLEVKKSVLEKKKIDVERLIDLEIALRAEFQKMKEEQSDLGVGYAHYEFPHLT